MRPGSGITTLYRTRDEHPSIFMAKPKEIGFFSGWHDEDVEWYKTYFAGAQTRRKTGELIPW